MKSDDIDEQGGYQTLCEIKSTACTGDERRRRPLVKTSVPRRSTSVKTHVTGAITKKGNDQTKTRRSFYFSDDQTQQWRLFHSSDHDDPRLGSSDSPFPGRGSGASIKHLVLKLELTGHAPRVFPLRRGGRRQASGVGHSRLGGVVFAPWLPRVC